MATRPDFPATGSDMPVEVVTVLQPWATLMLAGEIGFGVNLRPSGIQMRVAERAATGKAEEADWLWIHAGKKEDPGPWKEARRRVKEVAAASAAAGEEGIVYGALLGLMKVRGWEWWGKAASGSSLATPRWRWRADVEEVVVVDPVAMSGRPTPWQLTGAQVALARAALKGTEARRKRLGG